VLDDCEVKLDEVVVEAIFVVVLFVDVDFSTDVLVVELDF